MNVVNAIDTLNRKHGKRIRSMEVESNSFSSSSQDTEKQKSNSDRNDAINDHIRPKKNNTLPN